MARRLDFFDVVFYLILLLMIGWFVGKATGYISSPVWLEYFPVLGAVFGGGILYNKVDTLDETCDELKTHIESIKNKICDLGMRVVRVEARKK